IPVLAPVTRRGFFVLPVRRWTVEFLKRALPRAQEQRPVATTAWSARSHTVAEQAENRASAMLGRASARPASGPRPRIDPIARRSKWKIDPRFCQKLYGFFHVFC